jgi:pSer/pThr/pTyr-binding forkhead associated (FHA) protein
MMRDGHTQKLASRESEWSPEYYLQRNQVRLVVVNGPRSGTEFSLDDSKIVAGRGPGADLVFQDDAMSLEHVAFELVEGGYRARDLASTNGVRINGKTILVANLEHGDTVELGEHRLQYLVEARKKSVETHVIQDR